MELRDIIIKEVANIKKGATTYINKGNGLEGIDKDLLFNVRKIHELEKQAEIYLAFVLRIHKPDSFFEAERTYYDSVVLLNEGISIRKIEDTKGWSKADDFKFDFLWSEIDEVQLGYKESSDDNGKKNLIFFIKIFFNEDNEIADIPLYNFGGLTTEKDALSICNLINNILTTYNNQSEEHESALDMVLQDIKAEFKNGNFENVLEIADDNFILNEIDKTDTFLYYCLVFYTASSLKGLNRNQEALKIVNESLLLGGDSEGFKEWGPWVVNLKAELNEVLGNYYASLQDYYTSFTTTKNTERKSFLKEKLIFTYSKYKEVFSTLNYDKRKMVLIYDEIKVAPSDTFVILDKTNLPDNLKFPFSHPKKEELYIGHPYINEVYLPLNTYEASLFNDRFEEFSYFIQCLGAKSVTIKVLKGKERIAIDIETSKIDGSVGLGKNVIKNAVNGSYQKDTSSNKQEDSLTSRTRTQIYNPVKKPYIPENLLWYPHETSWHRLYQQRVNGNILKHHDVMSSKSSYSISKNEKSDLKVALKIFFAEIDVNRDNFIETTLTETETIEWEFEIEFESIDNLTEVHADNVSPITIAVISDVEDEYLEEVKFMLEDDGIIDDKERSILERFRVKKGISKERSEELENQLISQSALSDNEKEYLEEYTELLKDGEITEKERRILARFANRLSIPEERVYQLEKGKL